MPKRKTGAAHEVANMPRKKQRKLTTGRHNTSTLQTGQRVDPITTFKDDENWKQRPRADQIRDIVEEAKSRARDVGKPTLAIAVDRVYLWSLKSERLNELLKMILKQNALPVEIEEFQDYVGFAKRFISVQEEEMNVKSKLAVRSRKRCQGLSRNCGRVRRNLCTGCMEIDFDVLFGANGSTAGDDHVYRKWNLSLETDLLPLECALCELVYREANAEACKWNESSGHDIRRAYCELYRSWKTPSDQDVYCGYRTTHSGTARVEIRLSASETTSSASIRSEFWLDRLDHCRQRALDTKFDSQRHDLFVQRLLIPSTFDTTRLQAWISEWQRLKPGAGLEPSSSPTLSGLLGCRRFRVIDVNTGALYVPEQEVRYVALSYVWGESTQTWESACQRVLTEDRSVFNISNIPRTVIDAIAAVKSIGENYLWVDSVCIAQADAIDKEFIIPRMGSIFNNAWLTMIAADGEDAHAGLGRLVGTPSLPEFPTRLGHDDDQATIIKARDDLGSILRRAKWQSRGWTFQEAERSSAYIICTSDEISFQSKHYNARESYEPAAIGWSTREVTREAR